MKILVISHTADLFGGAERSMLDVLDSWYKEFEVEFEFILRLPEGNLTEALKKRKWKYHLLPFTFWSHGSPVLDANKNSVMNAKAVLEIEKIIHQSKPDIVMTNSIVSPWGAMAAYYSKIPHVWFAREYGDLDHGREFELTREQTFSDINKLSCHVFTNSITLAKHVSRYAPKEKVSALYTPFNLESIKKDSQLKVDNPFISEGSLKLIITSNLARTKGQLEAVKAVGILNNKGYNVEICLVGGATDERYNYEINEAIHKYKIKEKVHLVGRKDSALPYVALADVGIMESRKEAFGRVTFEFLALGKPVVGSNSGATPEMVLENKTGYLYDVKSVESLVKAIGNYAEKPDLVKTHSINATKLAIEMMQGKNNATAGYKTMLLAVKNCKMETPYNYSHKLLIDLANSEDRPNPIKRKISHRVGQKARRGINKTKRIVKNVIKK